jgi:hypothetical protein
MFWKDSYASPLASSHLSASALATPKPVKANERLIAPAEIIAFAAHTSQKAAPGAKFRSADCISLECARIKLREGKEMLALSRNIILVTAAAILSCTAAFAQASPSQSTITVTVTALGPNNSPAPEIPQADVSAYSNSTRLNITRWVRAQGTDANLQLAILIDNDLRTSIVGQQMQDLSSFINALPPTTSVGVFYAENGAATPAAQFTVDHAAAANSLHLTLGRTGGSPSIYLSLTDLVKNWPASTGARREALVIASGFDPLNPGVEDPYADQSVEAAEKSGIGVHTILLPNPRYQSTFSSNISEGKLIDATTNTGGQTLFEGAFVPVSLAPFLKQLDAALNSQYLLTFTIDQNNKKGGELRPLRVQVEEHNVKLYAPKLVLVP